MRVAIAFMSLLVPAYAGQYTMPTVPVVFQLDGRPDKMHHVTLPVRPGTFICTVYPVAGDLENPIRMGCLSVDPTTREVRRDIYHYPMEQTA